MFLLIPIDNIQKLKGTTDHTGRGGHLMKGRGRGRGRGVCIK